MQFLHQEIFSFVPSNKTSLNPLLIPTLTSQFQFFYKILNLHA